MKVFISDKDQNKYTYYYGGGRESIECRSTSEPMVVKSLEEHNKKLLQNFSDNIINYINKNKTLVDWNFSEYELNPDWVITHIKKSLKEVANYE